MMTPYEQNLSDAIYEKKAAILLSLLMILKSYWQQRSMMMCY